MSQTERAVLAGGCFWGMQDLIRRMPGVISTRVGYSGGEVPDATYRNHGSHAESVRRHGPSEPPRDANWALAAMFDVGGRTKA